MDLDANRKNLALFLIVTGGLHWWFYMHKGQGLEYKFDTHPEMEKNKLFSFNNHIYDNMFWSIVSGLPIWVGFEVLLLWSFASGSIEIYQFSDGWIWFCLWFPLMQIWQSFHFYWWHRILHMPLFYKLFMLFTIAMSIPDHGRDSRCILSSISFL